MEWLNAVAGFFVGLLVGLTGVGGGSLMAPILILLFGVAPVTAVGTDLWFAAITKTVGGIVHHNRGGVDWNVVRRLLAGSLPAALATLVWLSFSGQEQVRAGLVLTALGFVLILTAAVTLFRHRLVEASHRFRSEAHNAFAQLQPSLTITAGAILGTMVTLTSIGAGALGAAMLLCLYPRRMTPSRLVATDIVHAIPLTIVGGIGHLMLGNVNFGLLGMLLVGSVPGIMIGSLMTSRVPEPLLRAALAAAIFAVGIKMLA